MVDKRVERVERPRDEGVYSSRIERDRKEHEKFSYLPSQKEKKLLIATFFSYLKKIFDAFSPSKKLAGKVIDQQKMIEHLKDFKIHLASLGEKDLSNSSDFATQFSESWILLVDDFDNIEILERKNLSEISTFRLAINTIKNYPEKSDHRLGFYFLQHAGKDWLPFPFIEILEDLHKNHLENPKTSTLTHWMGLIDEVIESLTLPFPLQGQ